MKSNLVIKLLAIGIAVVLTVVALQASRTGKAEQKAGDLEGLTAIDGGPEEPDNGLSLDPLANDFLKDEYGVDVDSPIETMRTLTNETRAVREQSRELQDENKALKLEIERLLKLEQSINTRIDNKLSAANKDDVQRQQQLEKTQNATRMMIASFEDRLKKLQNEKAEKPGPTFGQTTANGYDIGAAAIPAGLGYDDAGVQVDFDELVWTNPLDAVVDEKDPTKMSLPDFSSVSAVVPEAVKTKTAKAKDKEERLIKAYTVPDNATLIGSISMTAMLGRIPINGQVVDPYPFKVIVGEENLSSNGIHIPGVTGIIMTGIAKGDWTLSCVSGEITSMTFTFEDGAITTIPEPGGQSKKPIAWFSDRNGVPCITGDRITNAASFLTQRVALSTASAYAAAAAQSQFTTQTNATGGMTSGLTGDVNTAAKNSAVSSGLNEITDWLDARQESSFDAVYVQPGTELAIHITDELRIDYDPEGRKVNHYASIPRRSDTQLD